MFFSEAIQSKMKWVRLFLNGLDAEVETIQTTSDSTKCGMIRSDNKWSSAL